MAMTWSQRIRAQGREEGLLAEGKRTGDRAERSC